MTPVQRTVLGTGMIVFSLMGLMPPWVHVRADDPPERVPAGYAFVTVGAPIRPNGPSGPRRRGLFRSSYRGTPLRSWSSEIDAGRLALQWCALSVVTGGLICLIGSTRTGRRAIERPGSGLIPGSRSPPARPRLDSRRSSAGLRTRGGSVPIKVSAPSARRLGRRAVR